MVKMLIIMKHLRRKRPRLIIKIRIRKIIMMITILNLSDLDEDQRKELVELEMQIE